MGEVHELGRQNFTRENLIDHLDRHAYYGVGTVISTAADRKSIALPVALDQQLGKIGGARYVEARARHAGRRRQPELHERHRLVGRR